MGSSHSSSLPFSLSFSSSSPQLLFKRPLLLTPSSQLDRSLSTEWTLELFLGPLPIIPDPPPARLTVFRVDRFVLMLPSFLKGISFVFPPARITSTSSSLSARLEVLLFPSFSVTVSCLPIALLPLSLLLFSTSSCSSRSTTLLSSSLSSLHSSQLTLRDCLPPLLL